MYQPQKVPPKLLQYDPWPPPPYDEAGHASNAQWAEYHIGGFNAYRSCTQAVDRLHEVLDTGDAP